MGGRNLNSCSKGQSGAVRNDSAAASDAVSLADRQSELTVEEASGCGELTPRQERALVALMTENSILRAAEVAGVAERTMHKWLDRPNFAGEYRRLRREAFRQAVSLSQKFASSAVVTLAKVMADPQAPYSAKVAAATAMLRFGREGIEIEDLQVRVENLERQNSIVEQGAPSASMNGWAVRRAS